MRGLAEKGDGFGEVAAVHALGDVWAMGAKPHSALALAVVSGAAYLVSDVSDAATSSTRTACTMISAIRNSSTGSSRVGAGAAAAALSRASVTGSGFLGS